MQRLSGLTSGSVPIDHSWKGSGMLEVEPKSHVCKAGALPSTFLTPE